MATTTLPTRYCRHFRCSWPLSGRLQKGPWPPEAPKGPKPLMIGSILGPLAAPSFFQNFRPPEKATFQLTFSYESGHFEASGDQGHFGGRPRPIENRYFSSFWCSRPVSWLPGCSWALLGGLPPPPLSPSPQFGIDFLTISLFPLWWFSFASTSTSYLTHSVALPFNII